MRPRKGRTALASLAIFLFVLFLILYLTSDGGNKKKVFAWTKIRYLSTSTTIYPAHGVCPGLDITEKPALVVSRVNADGDAEWLDPLREKYHVCVYTADTSTLITSNREIEHGYDLRVPANRGHEAMAYLTFIIDNYSTLPSAGIVFIHGSRMAWHNDSPTYDNSVLLLDLNITNAMEPNEYHNLRCDWSAGTCGPSRAELSEKKLLPQGSLETRMTAILEPWNKRAVSDAALPAAFALLFGGREGLLHLGNGASVLLGSSDTLRAQCCAQFVVSRDRILQHSRDEYIALRQWLLDSDSGAPEDDKVAGRILSYVWHVLFLPDVESEMVDLAGLNTLACPSAEQCYCRLYGRCNMGSSCVSPGHCRGQYSIPRDYKVPSREEAR